MLRHLIINFILFEFNHVLFILVCLCDCLFHWNVSNHFGVHVC